MICVWQVFGDFQNFTSIADTFILEFDEMTTIYGKSIPSGKVWMYVIHSLKRVSKQTSQKA
jgi:hypothetical protein